MAWQAVLVILLTIAWAQDFAVACGGQDSSPQIKTSCTSAGFGESYRAGEESLLRQKAATAVPYLEKAHQICPSDYAAGRDLLIAYGKAGLPEKASALGEQILREHDVAEIHSLLGELYREKNDFRSAAKQYQAAAQLDPSEENVFEFGSSLLKFEGDSALKIFRFGVEKYPNSEKMHLGLGGALYGQGLIDDAVSEAFKASEINPTDPEAMELLGQMAHIPAGMAGAVIERLAALTNLYPRNAKLTYYYAMALSGRWSDKPAADSGQVIQLLKTATELDPSYADAHFQLGELYQEEGRTLDALHSYQEAARLDPKQENYHYRLALAYKKSGYPEESRKEMQIYQKLHGNEQ